MASIHKKPSATGTITVNRGSASAIRHKLMQKVAFRLIGICFFGCLTGFLFFNSPYWMAGLWTALITVGLFLHTMQFVDRSERKLTAFLQALKQNDFSLTFSEHPTSDDYDLHRAFNQLNDIFKTLRSERESQHQLLQVVVEHASAPMICFEEDNGEVYLINNAAKQLLQIPFLQKINALARIDGELMVLLREIRDGQKKTFRLLQGGQVIFLSISSQHIRFEYKQLKLVALVDVTSELAAREAESWHKLLRVLTHEISNSAIPLSTLSSHIYSMVMTSRAQNRELSTEERKDILESLKIIDQRSHSLKEFVHNFRNVGQIPEPHITRLSIEEVCREAIHLFSKDFERDQIQLILSIGKETTIYADKNLTQQVLINLVKNALEAMSNMKDGKQIEIKVVQEGNRFVNLMIRDNGTGIDKEDLDQIFIPFYTTKKNGSGIGLSISQQIMQKQRGDIRVHSEPGKGSIFTLSFSC
ncbi:MAG: HAMP domain-containing histidine kinase [Cyclobacteriaceae bacterium]|nr:HAMP domain-containing histidine kinase [Cyclobacteriaceae bacterium]